MRGGMSDNTPWSVKGVAPECREAAKVASRKSGMTLGAWLNRAIMQQASAELRGEAAPNRTNLPALPSEAIMEALRGLAAEIREENRKLSDQNTQLVEQNRRLSEDTLVPMAQSVSELNQRMDVVRDLNRRLEMLRVLAQRLDTVRDISVKVDAIAQRMDSVRDIATRLDGIREIGAKLDGVRDLSGKMEVLRELAYRMEAVRDMAHRLDGLRDISTRLDQLRDVPQQMQQLRELPERTKVLDGLEKHLDKLDKLEKLDKLDKLEGLDQLGDRVRQAEAKADRAALALGPLERAVMRMNERQDAESELPRARPRPRAARPGPSGPPQGAETVAPRRRSLIGRLFGG